MNPHGRKAQGCVTWNRSARLWGVQDLPSPAWLALPSLGLSPMSPWRRPLASHAVAVTAVGWEHSHPRGREEGHRGRERASAWSPPSGDPICTALSACPPSQLPSPPPVHCLVTGSPLQPDCDLGAGAGSVGLDQHPRPVPGAQLLGEGMRGTQHTLGKPWGPLPPHAPPRSHGAHCARHKARVFTHPFKTNTSEYLLCARPGLRHRGHSSD